jgi:hypothetical protein
MSLDADAEQGGPETAESSSVEMPGSGEDVEEPEAPIRVGTVKQDTDVGSPQQAQGLLSIGDRHGGGNRLCRGMTADHKSLAAIGQPDAAKKMCVTYGGAPLTAVKHRELDPGLIIGRGREPDHMLGSRGSGVSDSLDGNHDAYEPSDAW